MSSDRARASAVVASHCPHRALQCASAGEPADYSRIIYPRIDAFGGVFWPCPDEEHSGTPRLFAESFSTPSGRARLHPIAHAPCPLFATQAACPHCNGPLADGIVRAAHLVCALHGMRFDLSSGRPIGNASAVLKTYPEEASTRGDIQLYLEDR